jgi:hypothetical protein
MNRGSGQKQFGFPVAPQFFGSGWDFGEQILSCLPGSCRWWREIAASRHPARGGRNLEWNDIRQYR